MSSIDIQQVGGVARPSILQTYASVADHDPWVLSAIGELTHAAVEQGFWDPCNLDETLHPPAPHRAHPIWTIVFDKRIAMTDDEAIWTRPYWLIADDGLPCVRWECNMPPELSYNPAGPSSSVPSDIDSDDFEEEATRGRRHTPRTQPATGVTHVQEMDDNEYNPEAEQATKDDEIADQYVSALECEEEVATKLEICKWD
ncbi:uncharacterized protein J3D65DRAFT_605919 [Phyllosticta citribraziliensis]|uniref:Uncharacterized protein n=1 Tax=Phyllosticta citribraziliensis TaxID=989973 RepID=A0ABR1LE68_9PEZI